jgi:two-component system sensor histidine kinase PilS (NtrC family)
MSKAMAVFVSSNPQATDWVKSGPIPFCLVRFENTSFTEIVCNLLDNAVSHSQKKVDSVSVEFVARQGWVSLIIRDDGSGIPEEHREKIFEPFFTTRNQGIGLGLFVARELAHAQGALLFYRKDQFGHSLVLDMKTS